MPALGSRILALAAVCAAAAALPAALPAAPAPGVARLQAEQRSLAREKRAAVLDLYALDSGAAAAGARLAALELRASELRGERALLERELRVARTGARVSERRLAMRLRMLYEHGGTSTLEVVLGARSLGAALADLDELDRVAAMNDRLLLELRDARARARRARAALGVREARLHAAIAAAAAEASTLASAREARAAYVARLASREATGAARLARVEAEARAAQAKAARLVQPPRAAAAAAPAPPTPRGGTLTVVATGYCLTGRTATGIPAGWGVAAVDPAVIPLGTRFVVPGYGEAVAADTGGAVAGARIDLWFPSCARAGGWGSQSVTIDLH